MLEKARKSNLATTSPVPWTVAGVNMETGLLAQLTVEVETRQGAELATTLNLLSVERTAKEVQ